MPLFEGTAENVPDLFRQVERFITGAASISNLTQTGTGDGLLGLLNTKPGSGTETWTLTATSASEFSVNGSVSGNQVDANVGEVYSNNQLTFRIQAGATPFEAGDTFTFDTTESEVYTDSVPWELLKRNTPTVIGLYPNTETQIRALGTIPDTGWDLPKYNYGGVDINLALAVEYDRPIELAEFRIRNLPIDPDSGPGPRAVRRWFDKFTVEYSDNNSDWTVVYTGNVPDKPGENVPDAYQLESGIGPHKYWRFHSTHQTGEAYEESRVKFEFVDVYGDTQKLGSQELYLKGKDYSGNEEIFVNLSSTPDIGTGLYNEVYIDGATAFDDTVDLLYQPGAKSDLYRTYIETPNTPFSFWLFVNPRRFCLVLQNGANYSSMYGGWFLPFATPLDYPYPLMVGGDHNDSTEYGAPDEGTYMLEPGNLTLIDPQNVWIVSTQTWPYSTSGNDDRRINNDVPGSSGIRGLLPVYVIVTADETQLYGQMDGVYSVGSRGLAAGDRISVDDKTFVVFECLNSDDGLMYCVEIY